MKAFSFRYLIFSLFVICSLTQSVNAGKYSDRPNIRSVEAKKKTSAEPVWESLKEGHVEAVAEIFGMYPEHEIYFLARDGELLFDLAQVIADQTGDKSALSRIHLINVSRKNMNDPHLKDYLAQEGIQEDALKAGKKVLLMDTGFAGTIPAKISELYPTALRKNIQTQLICSSNLKHPSSRVFLYPLNPAVQKFHPSKLHGTITDYEHRSRFTNRSESYQFVNQRWVPISPDVAVIDGDGTVSPSGALSDMADLKDYAQSLVAQSLYKSRREFWDIVRSQIDQGDSNALQLTLKSLLQKNDEPKRLVMVQDVLNIVETNFSAQAKLLPGEKELGIPHISQVTYGNKLALMENVPEWKKYLEDPETQIPLLIQNGDFQTLRAIADVIDDQEFMKILSRALGKVYPNSSTQLEIKKTVDGIIAQGNLPDLIHLANETFTGPNLVNLREEFNSLLEHPNSTLRVDLLKVFRKNQLSWGWGEELGKFIARTTDSQLFDLIINLAFKCTGSLTFADQLNQLIDRADAKSQKALMRLFSTPSCAPYAAPQLLRLLNKNNKSWMLKSRRLQRELEHEIAYDFNPITGAGDRDLDVPNEWIEILRRLIATRDQEILYKVATPFYSPKISRESWRDEFNQLINLGDQRVLAKLAFAFQRPYTKDWKPELQRLIKKGNSEVLKRLAEGFSKDHAEDWGEELDLIIKRGDQTVLKELAPIFDRAHAWDWDDHRDEVQHRLNRAAWRCLSQQSLDRLASFFGWKNTSPIPVAPHSSSARSKMYLPDFKYKIEKWLNNKDISPSEIVVLLAAEDIFGAPPQFLEKTGARELATYLKEKGVRLVIGKPNVPEKGALDKFDQVEKESQMNTEIACESVKSSLAEKSITDDFWAPFLGQGGLASAPGGNVAADLTTAFSEDDLKKLRKVILAETPGTSSNSPFEKAIGELRAKKFLPTTTEVVLIK